MKLLKRIVGIILVITGAWVGEFLFAKFGIPYGYTAIASSFGILAIGILVFAETVNNNTPNS